MTKTTETKQIYIKRALAKMQQANLEAFELHHHYFESGYKEKFQGKTYSCMGILNTCKWAKKNWDKKYQKNTWRIIRASLKFFSSIKLKQKKITLKEYKEINSILMSISGGEKNELPLRTSATKSKKINIKDLIILTEALSASKSKWAIKALIWLRAGILTGLRPIEWQTVKIENNKLIVKNAKATNNRSHGKTRTIDLSVYSKKEINIILKHIEIVKREPNWETYYHGCSRIIRTISRRVLKKNTKYPTLYSARHQFSANLKANGHSKVEVAALMGHLSDETAQRHYGRKTYGHKTRTPKADPLEARKVKKSTPLFTFDKKNGQKK